MSSQTSADIPEPPAPLAVGRPLTLDQIIAIWFDAKTKRTRSYETERAYASRLAEFRDLLRAGGLDLDGDPHQVAALAQGWADHTDRVDATGTPILVAPATYNQRLAILSSFYTFARKRGYLHTENPITLVERRPVQEYASANPLDPATVRQRMKAIDRADLAGKRDYALIGVLLHTGRRLAEVAALHWGSVQTAEPHITLTFARTKGGKVMHDTLPIQVGRALLAWLHAFYGPQLGDLALNTSLWVSLSPNSRGRALSKQAIGVICAQRIGTSKVHTLRHTFARTMEDAGAKVSEIQARLGHASLATTGRYLAALKRAENRHAEELARMFGFDDDE